MSAPSRRTVIVRFAQFLLLAGWGWLLLQPVNSTRLTSTAPLPGKPGTKWPLQTHSLFDRDPVLHGDPLPWATVRTVVSQEDYLVLPEGRPDTYWVVGRPDKTQLDRWSVLDPFAPLVGVLLALALPPLLAGRLADRRWNPWCVAALAAGLGGLAAGVAREVVFPRQINEGMIGYTVSRTRGWQALGTIRATARDLARDGWGDRVPPATLCGMAVVGLGVAGALCPLRRPPKEPPEPS